MLVVTVEVWPGGDMRRRRVVGTMTAANISELAEVSDYEVSIDGEPIVVIPKHRRSDGVWALVRRALS